MKSRRSICPGVLVALAAGLFLGAGAAQAAFVQAGAPFVFQDDFSASSPGNEPHLSKWDPDNDPNDQLNVSGGLMVIDKVTGGDAFVDTINLNYGAATEWVTEFRFRMGQDRAGDNNTPFIGAVDFDWADFRLHMRDGTNSATQFDLLWDDDSLVGPLTDDLNRNTFYRVVLHNHLNNLNQRVNDLYIGPGETTLVALAGTRLAMADGQGLFLRVGSPSTPPTFAVDFDYITVGQFAVPEPAGGMVLAGILAAVAMTRRKRR